MVDIDSRYYKLRIAGAANAESIRGRGGECQRKTTYRVKALQGEVKVFHASRLKK